MFVPKPRGALSGALFEALRSETTSWDDLMGTAPDHDDDAQIALWTLYELHYRGFDDADDALEWQVASHEGRSLGSFVQRDASIDQVRELLSVRSIYHLKESDPSAWLVPRLTAEPQAALMALQYDEYGAGNPNRLHAPGHRAVPRGPDAAAW